MRINYLPLNTNYIHITVTYTWCTLYPYEVSSWHAWFLRYWNCLFFTYADPMLKVKGHQQWYMCVALNGGYNHTNFDWAQYHSLEDKFNAKFLDTAQRTHEHWQLHRLTFFNVSQKSKIGTYSGSEPGSSNCECGVISSHFDRCSSGDTLFILDLLTNPNFTV